MGRSATCGGANGRIQPLTILVLTGNLTLWQARAAPHDREPGARVAWRVVWSGLVECGVWLAWRGVGRVAGVAWRGVAWRAPLPAGEAGSALACTARCSSLQAGLGLQASGRVCTNVAWQAGVRVCTPMLLGKLAGVFVPQCSIPWDHSRAPLAAEQLHLASSPCASIHAPTHCAPADPHPTLLSCTCIHAFMHSCAPLRALKVVAPSNTSFDGLSWGEPVFAVSIMRAGDPLEQGRCSPCPPLSPSLHPPPLHLD